MGDPGSWQYYNHATSIAITVLGVFFVGLRFLSRHLGHVPLGTEDVLILIALVNLFVVFAINIEMVEHGLGLHQSIVSDADIVIINKLLLCMECFYCTSIVFVKTSILTMYHRIFIDRATRIGAYILGFITISWAISIIFACIFQCTPVARAWDKSIPGHCINLKGSFIGNAVPNIVTDIAILTLPVSRVWRIQASLSERLSIISIFLLGAYVIFASIYRFVTLFGVDFEDMTYTLARTNAWCVVEVSSGIISACLPTLRPLIRTLFPGLLKSSPSTSEHIFRRQDDSTITNPASTAWNHNKTSDHIQPSQSDLETDADEYPLNRIKVQEDISWDIRSLHSRHTHSQGV
ncbi:hypothetical protein BO94DRAFT_538994 [Aspergillus sclerotioniger CBS 115572]|uniref:Rhodopsin domain-containing protein n=1 Tax=Aspergillus sclerotioniger CBS 115572 TaxID=1450535 RepID=A0A317VJB1_9EURO|nr:hypothetical protein BO94DRAFT_538994 [Aspergillus sclerotioniger CBS 115572]PWY73108.1 hypothetical protein BO94DRAFT_538994 [Aspergillus sclerotioniger CBS 115572]